MTTVAALVLTAAAVAAAPRVLSRGSARAVSPRLLAMPHVVSLAGLALAALGPLAWQAARVLRAARRTELGGVALAGRVRCRCATA